MLKPTTEPTPTTVTMDMVHAKEKLILSQPSSSSICERINSEFAFVKDARRNRLKHGKAEKLVALFHNLRLMFRMKQPMYTESLIGWNDEDNKSGVTKFGIAHYSPPTKPAKNPPARPAICYDTIGSEREGPEEEQLLLLQ